MLTARPSSWVFDTSRSLTVSIGSWATLTREDGTIWLKKQRTLDDDQNAIPYSFNYGAVGVGIGVGKLPVSFRPKSFPNTGKMYMLNTFVGNELTADDISGICRVQEISAAATTGMGGTATAMFLGIEPEKLAKALGVRVAFSRGDRSPVGKIYQ